MIKRLFFIVFTVFFLTSGALAQPTVRLKKQPSLELHQELKELISTELFRSKVPLAYAISGKETICELDSMPDMQVYKEDFIEDQLGQIRADPSNYKLYTEMGAYYKQHNRPVEALHYFQQAYQRLDLLKFESDTAKYYFERALLKVELGDSTSFQDFERSLQLNPHSLSDIYVALDYLYGLMMTGEHGKLRMLAERYFEKGGKEVASVYFVYMFSHLSVGVSQLLETITTVDFQKLENTRAEYLAMPYDKLFDYSHIDKYARLFPLDTTVQLVRNLADVLGLYAKLFLYEDTLMLTPVFMVQEQERLLELERIFSPGSEYCMDEYSRLKQLGVVKWMQGKPDTAIVLFEQAITVFPEGKRDQVFNPEAAYNLLEVLHYLRKDYPAQEAVIKRKIAAAPYGASTEDLIVLAKLALRDNRLSEAMSRVEKVRETDPDNFEALALLSHLYFLSQNYSLSQFYLEEAGNFYRDYNDVYGLLLQITLYQIAAGNAAQAYDHLNKARTVREMENKNRPALLCDEIEEKYLILSE